MNRSNSEGKFYFRFIQIPAEALFNPNLSYTDMLIFSFINNMSTGNRGCWASNKYFADVLRVTKRTVSSSISRLEREGYILTDVREKGRRYIFIDNMYKERHGDLVDLFNEAYVENDPEAREEFKNIRREE